MASSRKRKRKRREKKKSNDADAEKKSKTEETYYDNAPVPGSEAFANDRTIYIEGVPFKATEHDVREFSRLLVERYSHVDYLRGMTLVICGGMDILNSIQLRHARRLLSSMALISRIGTLKWRRGHGCLVFCSKRQEISRKFSDQRDVESVFVKNIPYDTTEEDMREAFKVCGVIDGVRLAVWGHTNQLKGFGYVDFKKEESAEIAVKKTGAISIKGRVVLVDFETGKAKLSFKGPQR